MNSYGVREPKSYGYGLRNFEGCMERGKRRIRAMEKKPFLVCGTVSPQLLHLFKHATMNFERKAKWRIDRITGRKRMHYKVTKRKRPRYISERSIAVPADELVKKIRANTRTGRDEAVVRHRAARLSRGNKTRRELAEVLGGLSKEEQGALASSPHVVTAIEKIVEAMLFRFS